jgi:hypothetical protein
MPSVIAKCSGRLAGGTRGRQRYAIGREAKVEGGLEKMTRREGDANSYNTNCNCVVVKTH